ncbi:MAG: glycosyltransferase family 4 protein [Gemmatimonadaceae bacterium]
MLLSLLPELAQQGCRSALLCLDGPDTEVCKAAEDLGIPTAFVNCAQRMNPRGWYDLYRTIGACEPRLVHVHGYKATILAGAASLARHVPTVATYHGVAAKAGELSKSHARYLVIESPVLRRFRGIAAVSEQIGDELRSRGVRADRIRVIPNGIDVPQSHSKEHSQRDQPRRFDPCILSLSRLAPEKNVHLVIDAVAALRAEFPNIGLIVAGHGNLLGELRARAQSLGVENCIRFVGFVRDVRPLFAGCDVFVLASQTEGMPMSLLEAMALEVPIVASRVGGIPLMVRDEREALLIEPNDYPSLYQALRRLLAENGMRRRLARSARERFEHNYTAERMAASYIQLYDDVTARG